MKIYSITGRKFILLLVLFSLIARCKQIDTQQQQDYSKTPVLFVHGHGMSPDDFQPFIKHLQGVGYPSHYLVAVDILPNTMANVQAAYSFIAPAADSLLKRAKQAALAEGYRKDIFKLDIVSHSMGAVSARWYATKIHPERVRKWISVTGANHGTNTLCEFEDEAAREMCPSFASDAAKNVVQVELNGTLEKPIDETPYGIGMDNPGRKSIPPDKLCNIEYFTIRIDPDKWIKPEKSAILDGAGGIDVSMLEGIDIVETSSGNFLFKGSWGLFNRKVNHSSILYHPDFMDFVSGLLGY